MEPDKAPRRMHHRQVIRADPDLLSEFVVDPREDVGAPLPKTTKAKRSTAKAPETQAFAPPTPVPSWARASGRAGEGDPVFAAGAGLALLDAFLRRDPPAAGALRQRLALMSAAASAKILRVNGDEGALRDLRFAVGDALGPAANLLRLWRDLTGHPPGLDPGQISDAVARLDLAVDPNGLAASLKACVGEDDPVSAAAKAAAAVFSAFPDAPTAASEILAFWVFDLVLAIRLRWARPLPMIATKNSRSDPPIPGRQPTAKAGRSSLAKRRRGRDRAGRRLRPRPCRRSLAPLENPDRRRAQTAIEAGHQNRRPAARRGLRCARRSGPPRADDRPRRAPAVRPARCAWRRARVFGPAHVPAVRPMTAAARRRRREGDEPLDVELFDLPPAARWREWMLRVEAAIFASPNAVAREALGRLVGEACRFDDLIADLIDGCAAAPTILPSSPAVTRCAPKAASPQRSAPPIRSLGSDGVAEFTRTQTFALTAIAYLQPVTRGEISRLAGREISRDIIAALKRHGLIDGAIRAPQPGAPFAYVTTRKFLEVFGFASLRDLPDLEQLKADGLTRRGQTEDGLDNALGLADDEELGIP